MVRERLSQGEPHALVLHRLLNVISNLAESKDLKEIFAVFLKVGSGRLFEV